MEVCKKCATTYSTISKFTCECGEEVGRAPAKIGPREQGLYPVGTKIRFKATLESGPDEHSPGNTYASKGEKGTITGHGTKEGYWVQTNYTKKPFGASEDEFEVIGQQEAHCHD